MLLKIIAGQLSKIKQTFTKNYMDNQVNYDVYPIIKNQNDVYKLNGFMYWLNNYADFNNTHNYYNQIEGKNIWLSNPNLSILNNYLDWTLISNYKFNIYKLNCSYIKDFEKSYQKIGYDNLNVKTFWTSSRNFNIKDTNYLLKNFDNYYLELKLYGFNYPEPNIKSTVCGFYKKYLVYWDTILSEKNVSSLIDYLYRWNEKADDKCFLFVHVNTINPLVLNTLNIKLYQMYKLNYKFVIKVQPSMVIKYLDKKYWINGLVSDNSQF